MCQINIFLLLTFAFLPIKTSSCDVYLSNETLPSTICATESKGDEDGRIFHLQRCEGKQVCNFTNKNKTEGKCADKYGYLTKYPGEYCTEVDKCSYSNCTNNKCPGIPPGQKCNDTFTCEPGLFCESKDKEGGICVERKREREECKDDEECKINMVCNNKECVRHGSLSIGKEANKSFACQTLFIEDGKCAEPYKLKDAEKSLECPKNESKGCTYKNSKGDEIRKDCECVRGAVRTKFCVPGVGDFNINWYKDFLNNYDHESRKCNSPEGLFCKDKSINELGEDFYKAYVVYKNITNFTHVYNNTFYAKYLMEYDYWYSRMHTLYAEKVETSYIFLFITIGIVIVLDILILFLYFKKWKSDAEIIDKMK